MLKRVLYSPVQNRFLFILILFLGIMVPMLIVNVAGLAFQTLFPTMGSYGILLILATSLFGGFVNVPLKTCETTQPIVRVRRVTVFGVTYPVPAITTGSYKTLLAINIGGAIVPTVTSVYLLTKTMPALPSSAVAILAVTLVVKAFSRPIKGAGVIVPTLIPPVTAALAGTLLGDGYSPVVAYVSGTLGTLIGADLLNMRKILRIGAPVISIGGAGTFDGIFLSGIIAVLLSA